jgi:hypothetical protein
MECLFHNDGSRWSDVSAQAGDAFQRAWVPFFP